MGVAIQKMLSVDGPHLDSDRGPACSFSSTFSKRMQVVHFKSRTTAGGGREKQEGRKAHSANSNLSRKAHPQFSPPPPVAGKR